MARATAEAGLLMIETTFGPMDLYGLFVPLHGLGAHNLTLLAFTDSLLMRDQRGLLLTGLLGAGRMADGMKTADGSRVSRRAGEGTGMGCGRRASCQHWPKRLAAVPYERTEHGFVDGAGKRAGR